MRKLLGLLILGIFVTTCAFAAQVDDYQLAELKAMGYAHQVTSGDSVIMNIYYTDNTNNRASYAQLGITYSSTMLLYEAGTAVAAARFGGLTGTIDLTAESANTVGELVDAINGDSSGYWHATLGKDGLRWMNSRCVSTYLAAAAHDTTVDANVPSSAPVKLNFMIDHIAGANMMPVGVDSPGANGYLRLKYLSESTRFTSAAGVGGTIGHWIEAYDGATSTDEVGTYGWSSTATCNASGTEDPSMSFNTVNLSDGNQGWCTHAGNKLVVLVRWPDSGTFNGGFRDNATGNVTIIVDEFKP